MSLLKRSLLPLSRFAQTLEKRPVFGLLGMTFCGYASLFFMLPVQAEPAAVFAPYLSQLLEQTPTTTQVRLPSGINLRRKLLYRGDPSLQGFQPI